MIEGVVAVGVVLALIGGMVAVAVVQKVILDSGSTYKEGVLAPAPTPQFIGPALSSEGDEGECQQKMAAERGASWTGNATGWRAPNVWPEPTPDPLEQVPDPATMRGRWRAWADGMNGLMADIRKGWPDCKGSTKPPEVAVATPKPTINGTFEFEFEPGNCKNTLPPMKVGITEKPFTMVLQSAQDTATLTGALQDRDLTFRASGEQNGETTLLPNQVGTTKTHFRIELEGRFDLFEDRTIIREGRGEVEVRFDNQPNPPCTFTYSAKRPS